MVNNDFEHGSTLAPLPAELGLFSFIAAYPSPAIVIPTPPLYDSLEVWKGSRRSHRDGGGGYGTPSAHDRLAMPRFDSGGASRGNTGLGFGGVEAERMDVEMEAAVLTSLAGRALVVECGNLAWRELRHEESDGDGGVGGGDGQGNRKGKASASSSSFAPLTTTTTTTAISTQQLPEADQNVLLARLLDLLETKSAGAPTAKEDLYLTLPTSLFDTTITLLPTHIILFFSPSSTNVSAMSAPPLSSRTSLPNSPPRSNTPSTTYSDTTLPLRPSPASLPIPSPHRQSSATTGFNVPVLHTTGRSPPSSTENSATFQSFAIDSGMNWEADHDAAGGGTWDPREGESEYEKSLGDTGMGKMIRDFPWHSTSLGPIKDWGPELKSMVSMILASPFRESILWGEEHIMIYNDHYIGSAGGKHPYLLGRPGAEGWKEIWSGLAPIVERVMAGNTHFSSDTPLPMHRNGFFEETYHTFSYVPFRDGNGKVLGFVNLSIETTSRVIAERRLATVRDLVQTTSWTRTIPDFCSAVMSCFVDNPFDLPFTALYTAKVLEEKLTAHQVLTGKGGKASHTTIELSLQGQIGIPPDHPFAPSVVQVDLQDLRTPRSQTASSAHSTARSLSISGDHSSSYSWPFEDICTSLEPSLISLSDVPSELLAGLESRGWEEGPRLAIVLPLLAEAGQLIPSGVLVLGLNPRAEWDQTYETFVKLVSHHIGIGILAVTNAEADARRAADLMALDRAKSTFIANASHELRTPLTLILGPLEDVLSNSVEPVGKANKDKLMIVKRHANRLLTMVNQLLDFSALEGGRLAIKYHPVKMGDVTRDIATLFRDSITRMQISYEVECDNEPEDCMPCYISLEIWEKIVFNIIGNAMKYTKAGGSIVVTLKATRAEVVFAVRDTGVGIPENELTRIFERFHRVEGTATVAAGTGIGLALTMELVKILGGQLDVASKFGEGSTFSVRMPRGFTHLSIDQVSHNPEATSSIARPLHRTVAAVEEASLYRNEPPASESTISTSSDSQSGSASGADSSDGFLMGAELLNFQSSVVLLADDSPDLLNYISGILSRHFTVVAVKDGQEALEYALKKPVSLVVTDIAMPRLDGRGLLKALRANASTSLIPLIFLSAQASIDARTDALENGADDYLSKPFQPRELIARSRLHLQLGKMRRELERRVVSRTAALRESELKYRELADRSSMLSLMSPVGIFLTNKENVVTYANPRFYEITGLPKDAPVAKWTEYVAHEHVPRLDEFWRLSVSGTAASEHLELQFTSGNWAQLELRSEKEGCYVGAITDISKQKHLEILHIQGVEQRIADAEDHRRHLEIFIDTASHELRNPLSGVWQNAEVLSQSLERITEFIDDVYQGITPERDVTEDILEEMQANTEAVESILICATHQGRICDDILNLSKLNLSLVELSPAPCNIEAKIRDVIRMFEIDCAQKQIDLRLSVENSLAALHAEIIVVDAARLAQMLINFLANSVKYTSDSTVRQITVRVQAFTSSPPLSPNAMRIAEPTDLSLPPESVWIMVGVEDSGKGLSSEELKKLFARFSQANPRTDQYGGSGMGLYVSRKLVELHRGYIEVTSLPGKGSTFSFAVPVPRAPALTNQSTASLAVSQTPTAVSTSTPTGSSTTIRGKRPSSATPRLGAKMSRFSPGSEESLANLAGSKENGGGALELTGLNRSLEAMMDQTGAVVPSGDEPKDHTIHVLVVEDNDINRKVLYRQLTKEGFEVTLSCQGREGLDTLLAEKDRADGRPPISVVLMDIEMPVLDGLSAIRELRTLEKEGVMPVHYNSIAVTGNARKEQIDECIASGFEEVAIKPYKIKALIEQVRRFSKIPETV